MYVLKHKWFNDYLVDKLSCKPYRFDKFSNARSFASIIATNDYIIEELPIGKFEIYLQGIKQSNGKIFNFYIEALDWVYSKCEFFAFDKIQPNQFCIKEVKNEVDRPSWQDYFLGQALLASARSPDAETKHGCVIVDKNKHVLGTGYNGFPRGMKDNELPNTRPMKYPFVIHAEVNAVTNCILKPDGATAYVTGESCTECLKHLWQNGVIRVVQANKQGSVLIDEETRKIRKIFLEQTGLEVVTAKPELSWLATLVPTP